MPVKADGRLTRQVLESMMEGRTPRLHPNGFIQIDLNDEGSMRFHVWPEEPFPGNAGEFTLHDHVWELESRVLCGTLIHTVVEPRFSTEPRKYREWQATGKDHGPRKNTGRGGKYLEPTGRYANTVLTTIYTLRPGMTYTFPAFEFHTSQNRGLTATMFRKSQVFAGEPTVLCDATTTPDALFKEMTADVGELWTIIRQALQEVEREAN